MSAVLDAQAGGGETARAAAAPPRRAACGQPVVSVVVPTCARPKLLLRCLQALLAQTLADSDFEILVVDDGRSEATQILVETLARQAASPKLRYLRPSGGHGPAVARNAGWRAAHGEIVAFTDDDTVPRTDWLAQGVEALRHSRCSALGGRVVVPRSNRPPTDHERMTQALERTEFVTANAFVRRSALHQVQGFDERFTRAWREDSDLQFRLHDIAGPVGRCEAAVVVHPVRRERWGVSLRQQKNAYFEALLYAKHPRRYRQGAGLPPPWDYYTIVVLSLAAPLFARAGIAGSALMSAALAALLMACFAVRRLRGTSHSPSHVLEMLLSSALIPFLSVYWRLRGALHFRVWFV
jgi:GT2 family glycosyltransferase